MSPTPDVDHFRARLLEARAELRAFKAMRDSSAATVELDQASVGRLSRMDALQQQAVAQDMRQRASQALARIGAAARRCDDGSYGDCLACGEPIDPRRLEVDPATPLCICSASAPDG